MGRGRAPKGASDAYCRPPGTGGHGLLSSSGCSSPRRAMSAGPTRSAPLGACPSITSLGRCNTPRGGAGTSRGAYGRAGEAGGRLSPSGSPADRYAAGHGANPVFACAGPARRSPRRCPLWGEAARPAASTPFYLLLPLAPPSLCGRRTADWRQLLPAIACPHHGQLSTLPRSLHRGRLHGLPSAAAR
jgi:hypothetical protein